MQLPQLFELRASSQACGLESGKACLLGQQILHRDVDIRLSVFDVLRGVDREYLQERGFPYAPCRARAVGLIGARWNSPLPARPVRATRHASC
jgi:hypothetical protein